MCELSFQGSNPIQSFENSNADNKSVNENSEQEEQMTNSSNQISDGTEPKINDDSVVENPSHRDNYVGYQGRNNRNGDKSSTFNRDLDDFRNDNGNDITDRQPEENGMTNQFSSQEGDMAAKNQVEHNRYASDASHDSFREQKGFYSSDGADTSKFPRR